MIWFVDLDRKTNESYDGNHQGQIDITAEDVMRLQGEVASPGQLRKEIQELQNSLSNVKYTLTVMGTILLGIVLAAFRVISLPSIFAPANSPPSAVQNAPSDQDKKPEPRTPVTVEQPKDSPLQLPKEVKKP